MYGVIRFVLYKMIETGISCVVSATATDDTTGCILFAGASRQTDVNKFIKKGSWGHWPIWHLPDFTDLSQVRVQPEIISRTDCLRWRQLQSSCDELLFSVTAPSILLNLGFPQELHLFQAQGNRTIISFSSYFQYDLVMVCVGGGVVEWHNTSRKYGNYWSMICKRVTPFDIFPFPVLTRYGEAIASPP